MALTDNLVAYYKLDESSGNPSDSSGNGYTLTNNNTVSFTTGKISNGADFGASNSSKYFSHASLHGFTSPTNAHSGSCWLNISTAPGVGEVQQFWSQFIGETTGGDWKMYYHNSGGTLRIYVQNDGSGAFFYNTTLTIGTWYHMAFTFSGSNAAGSTKLYLNGSEVASGNLYGTIDYSAFADSFTIGANRNGSSNFTKGLVDEVGQWSRELSSAEITSLYNGGSGLTHPFVSGPTNLKSYNTNLKANIKSINTNLIANVKSLNTNV